MLTTSFQNQPNRLRNPQGIQPEVRTYNTIITACNKSARPEEGLTIYERMVRAGVKPTATTYTALISAYGKQGKVEQAMGIFADMVARGCERNVITYSSLIRWARPRERSLTAACLLFTPTRNQHPASTQPTPTSPNRPTRPFTNRSAAEKAGRTDLALQLFDRMQQEGCRPNVVTYNSLIAACSHGGHWEDAERCFQQMLSQGCSPDGITYSALITAFERGGQWRRALGAYSQMTAQVGFRLGLVQLADTCLAACFGVVRDSNTTRCRLQNQTNPHPPPRAPNPPGLPPRQHRLQRAAGHLLVVRCGNGADEGVADLVGGQPVGWVLGCWGEGNR